MPKFLESHINQLICFLLCILGFSSCARKNNIEKEIKPKPIIMREIRVLYGPPPTQFREVESVSPTENATAVDSIKKETK
ncbi:MAG: hypothetical protein MJY95_05720 [Bacteroidaceae bacterium]|nr:hypothetical protein [Bacteroidaceae bacterium]